MAISLSQRPQHRIQPSKLVRRTATSVMAGAFDPRPQRDVLTSLLNGVPLYKPAEQDDKRARQRLKRQRDKERKRQKRQEMKLAAESRALEQFSADGATSSLANTPTGPRAGTSSSTRTLIVPMVQPAMPRWHDRPIINIASVQRSQSVTPPPTSPLLDHAESTPASTPGPSISSSTSHTSSKRLRTPDDDEDIFHSNSLSLEIERAPTPAPAPPPRKKRQAARKGWKGWVEGSPPPSEKLIQLDAAPILQERRTRSGKNFDAIGIGKDSWV